MQPCPLLCRLFATAGTALALLVPAAHAQPGERATHAYGASRPIAGQYIVTFKPGTDARSEAAAIVQAHAGRVLRSYSHALQGFSAALPDAAVEALRRNPNIHTIEQDQTVSLNQAASPQGQVTWGLDRIDQVDRPLDTQYHYTGTGAGVHAFILDTGIRADHVEFTGRLLPGYNAIADSNGTDDCNGHGTHVAGTLGGTTWGVAKGVSLTPVRVLGCSGSGAWSGVIAGIDFVASSALRPAVANLSLSGGASASVDAAIAGAIAKGVTMVVAAGNSAADACSYSPARVPAAITVGATDNLDTRATYSNFGTCVDLFAPGHAITSAWHTSNTSTNTMGGTSMATPHVAGVAALALAARPTASPADVATFLTTSATPNRLLSLGTGSPNLLLYSLGTGGEISPPAQPTQTVALKSMTGSATKTGGNWRASAVVAVRDVNSGSPVANATVTGSFSPGGQSSCMTDGSGSCTVTSGPMKMNSAASSTLGATGVSGTLLYYDASQNAVSQIVIARP